MRTLVSSFIFLCACALLFSCGKQEVKIKPVTLETHTFKKMDGKDCDKPDSLRINCASIDLRWPEVKEGSELLKKSVTAWTNEYMVGLLSLTADSTGSVKTKTIDQAAKEFFAMHEEWTKESPDSPAGYYVAECSDTTLLNDGKYLTIILNAYTFTGGAHGMPLTGVRTFDVNTGKILTWADLITDTAAVKALAEKKFREVNAEIFQPDADGNPGFEFDDVFQFKLPDNYGLTENGIYLYYEHYEVMAYAYGSTGFILSFAELGKYRKQ